MLYAVGSEFSPDSAVRFTPARKSQLVVSRGRMRTRQPARNDSARTRIDAVRQDGSKPAPGVCVEGDRHAQRAFDAEAETSGGEGRSFHDAHVQLCAAEGNQPRGTSQQGDPACGAKSHVISMGVIRHRGIYLACLGIPG